MFALVSILNSLIWLLEAGICGFVLAIWKIEDIMVNLSYWKAMSWDDGLGILKVILYVDLVCKDAISWI